MQCSSPNMEARMESSVYGYLIQKGNRWFIKAGRCINYSYGFKSKKQFEKWLEEQFKIRGLDWRAGYSWKYRDSILIYELVNKKTSPLTNKTQEKA